jgi:hypothetical protein
MSGQRKRPNSGYKVFISHASGDKWLAKVNTARIEATGATAFRDDRDIDGGDDIPERIRKEIKSSREMVVLLTPLSVRRPWVLFEVGAAWGWRQNARIVTIRQHIIVDRIPELIKAKKSIDLNEVDAYLGELVKRIKKAKNV